MVAKFENPVRRVPPNIKGRDFVVGDIHGCFDLVLKALERVNFDAAGDRLFSVGDMIDRGPGSHRTAKFLSNPWIHAVRGNHEDMLLEIYQDGEPHQAVIDYMTSRNGFDWWLGASDEVRADVLAAVAKLPLVIEIPTVRGLVGAVHADIPQGMGWERFTSALEAGDEKVAHIALWGRDRIHQGDEAGVEGIGRVFVGHTPLRNLTKLGNIVCIDTGAVYGFRDADRGALTFVDVMTATNVLTTVQSMGKPHELVTALTEKDRSARPFSPPLPR